VLALGEEPKTPSGAVGGKDTMALAVAFCGIDGSGKTSLLHAAVARLRQEGRSNLVVLKSHVQDTRRLLDRTLDYSAPGAYAEGLNALWTTIGSALDYVRYFQENVAPRLLAADDAVLMLDRSPECYIAYSASVRPTGDWLVSPLIRSLPRASLTFFVDVPASVAWARVQSRPEGPGARESLVVLERMSDAYHRLFERRSDVVRVDNTGDADHAVALILDSLGQTLRGG
jgi:thymidylate kinase